MLKIYRLTSILMWTFALHLAWAEPRAGSHLSPKVFLRMSGGLISNIGSSAGSTFSYGGASLGGLFYFTRDVALGTAYRIETTFSSVPLKGFDIFGRYYFKGTGTVLSTTDTFENAIERQSPWAAYTGVEFSQRTFNLKGDPEAILVSDRVLAGTISAGNAIAGVDFKISRKWEANMELSYTLFPFGGSDSRVKIKWILLSLGGAYLF